MMNVEFQRFVSLAKNIIKETGIHHPQFLLDTGTRYVPIMAYFNDDTEKEATKAMLRKLISVQHIKHYFFITEAWMGHNLDVRPSEDPKRASALIVMEFTKGEQNKILAMPFSGEKGSIVWGQEQDMSGEGSYSTWDFYKEDVMDEVIGQARKEAQK